MTTDHDTQPAPGTSTQRTVDPADLPVLAAWVLESGRAWRSWLVDEQAPTVTAAVNRMAAVGAVLGAILGPVALWLVQALAAAEFGGAGAVVVLASGAVAGAFVGGVTMAAAMLQTSRSYPERS